MIDDRKYRHVGYLAKTVSNLVNRRIQARVAEVEKIEGISARHGWVLGYLIRNKDKEIYQKDIEKEFDITKSTVTAILKNMEKNGHIERKFVEGDARLRQIVITEKGEMVHQIFFDNIMSVEDEINSLLTEEEIKEYARISKKLIQNINSKKV